MFAKALQKRFGQVENITDKDYITDSSHIHIAEEIDAYARLALEAKFQALSSGGATSYVDAQDMNDPNDVLTLIKFIYDNTIYTEMR